MLYVFLRRGVLLNTAQGHRKTRVLSQVELLTLLPWSEKTVRLHPPLVHWDGAGSPARRRSARPASTPDGAERKLFRLQNPSSALPLQGLGHPRDHLNPWEVGRAGRPCMGGSRSTKPPQRGWECGDPGDWGPRGALREDTGLCAGGTPAGHRKGHLAGTRQEPRRFPGRGSSCAALRAVQPWDGIFPLLALEQHRAAVYQRCVRIQSPGLSASPPVIARLRGA